MAGECLRGAEGAATAKARPMKLALAQAEMTK
jgi:hypothetical protein